MPRRRRTDPFNEGSLLIIYERFFKPLIDSFCGVERTAREFMEDLFDIDHRTLSRWQVKKAFNMPGLLVVTGNVKQQGLGWRRLSKGTIMVVREDSRSPDEIQLDFIGGKDNAEWVYSLSLSEWNWVKLHLTSMEEHDQIRA